MSINKCELDATTSLVFLGVVCDSAARTVFIPEDKLAKMERIIYDALGSGTISFHMLEKVAETCTTMSVACPAAALYTHHMYQDIACFQRTGGRKSNTGIVFAKSRGLFLEFQKSLEVLGRMNEASWCSAVH